MKRCLPVCVALAAAIVGVAFAVPRSETLFLSVNKSAMIEFQTDIDDVIIANPGIANIAIRNPRLAAVMGIASGESNVVFLDRNGRQILDLDVSVSGNALGELQSVLGRYFPDSALRAENVNGVVLLSGRARSAGEMEKAISIARHYSEDDEILNMVTVMGKDQVLLKVRIVEMQRSVIKQLGINLGANFGNITQIDSLNLDTGEITGGRGVFEGIRSSTNNGFPVNGAISGGLNLVGEVLFGAASKFEGSINALERVGLVKTLAEPNLTAISGETAKFLAGGEFPIPVSQENGRISVSYKPFGVGLSFTPTVLSEQRISLSLSTEISETTSVGSFNIGSSNSASLQVPGLKVRRTNTTVELPSGGSLVVAGLIQERSSQVIEGAPWLKDLPIIGALFRSRDFLNEETEMVVLVTPYLVEPTDPGNLRTPDRGFLPASDLHGIFLGKLNQVYSVGSQYDDRAVTGSPSGPVGFIIEQEDQP